MAEKIIYAISDSLGETAEAVARATASQYDKEQIEIIIDNLTSYSYNSPLITPFSSSLKLIEPQNHL